SQCRRCVGADIVEMYRDARILLREVRNGCRKDGGRKRLGKSNPQFSHGRVSQMFDVPDALLQLIEDRNAALEQGITIDRRFDALCASIEEPHPERMLEVDDHL